MLYKYFVLGELFLIERFKNLLMNNKVLERNELEKRLENESVYDTLMDVCSQLNLIKSGMKVHGIGSTLSTIFLSWEAIERRFYKEISFLELREKDMERYEDILDTVSDTLKNYSVKI
jgi:hypothetical protein